MPHRLCRPRPVLRRALLAAAAPGLSCLLACTPPPQAGDSGASDSGASDSGASDGGTQDSELLEPACLPGATAEVAGALSDERLVEASGMALSRTRPGVIWSHNDSGGGTQLFALDQAGQTVDLVEVEQAVALDWEDMAAGDWLGTPSLFVGDIGDNASARVFVTLWILPEPPAGATSAVARELHLSYPDGPHDAEALIVDPIDGSITIVTKVKSGPAGVYWTEQADAEELELALVASVEASSAQAAPLTYVTAGDVSPDGRCVGLRTYSDLVAWERDPTRPLYEALEGEPMELTVQEEPQGEALAMDTDAYWTLSEGMGEPLYRYSIEEADTGDGR